MYQNLHTHTRFSDGSDNPEEYIKAAIALGMTSIGFSDHSPLPVENTFALRKYQVREYCDAILLLRDQFSHTETQNHLLEREVRSAQCEIFLGMEADYIPGMGHSFAWFQENFPLDFLIGSVHLVRNGSPDELWFIDGPDPATYDDGLNKLFGGDIRKGVTAYYAQINEMLTTSKIDIIGHLDKIKMHNRGRLFSETDPWYVALVNETLELVKQTGVIVEVNTRGVYKKRSDSPFPGPAVLKRIHDLNIPVIISSDAHKPAEISMLFQETAVLLSEIGFRELMNLTPAGWETISI
ncbi:MAG: histidinol-phosphatase [Bacteroidales bacterium]|nr:histidinol-phosphatase [Bacteroidales bacterium]